MLRGASRLYWVPPDAAQTGLLPTLFRRPLDPSGHVWMRTKAPFVSHVIQSGQHLSVRPESRHSEGHDQTSTSALTRSFDELPNPSLGLLTTFGPILAERRAPNLSKWPQLCKSLHASIHVRRPAFVFSVIGRPMSKNQDRFLLRTAAQPLDAIVENLIDQGRLTDAFLAEDELGARANRFGRFHVEHRRRRWKPVKPPADRCGFFTGSAWWLWNHKPPRSTTCCWPCRSRSAGRESARGRPPG